MRAGKLFDKFLACNYSPEHTALPHATVKPQGGLHRLLFFKSVLALGETLGDYNPRCEGGRPPEMNLPDLRCRGRP